MRILIIGDLEGQIGAASAIARENGAQVANVPTIDAGLDALRAGRGADVVLIDVQEDVPRLMRSLTAERIHVPVVGCGLHADSKAAARAIRAGAKEYLPLPPDADTIAAVLSAIAGTRRDVIAAAPAMRAVLDMAEHIAPSEATVLITGESGTGKEVIARFIHRKSKRAGRPMVSVNCAAIPVDLLESELFGHEKGAFTGAVARRVGKFEEASGGTLLLDEVSEMEPRLQAKLLRALQEQEIDRVGGSQPVKVNLRVLATSNRDLEASVANGDFREDLYFRLNVINLVMPPLRERPEDIAPLACHFVEKYAALNGLPAAPALAPEALARLQAHHWRGNVRELENTMHRAVLLARGPVIAAEAIHLSAMRPVSSATATARDSAAVDPQFIARTVDSMEKELVLTTLAHCLGNQSQAAGLLGLSVSRLRERLKAYENSQA